MAVADKLDVQVLDLFQGAQHMGVLIGPDDVVEIVFVSFGEIPVHPIVEHPLIAVMAAEAVAGEEGLFFGAIGVHGIGPVEHGHLDEAEGQAAQVDLVLFGDSLAGEGLVDDLLQKGQGGLGAQHSGVGGDLQHPGHRAGVVGFGVVHNDVVDFSGVHHLADLFQVFIKKFILYCFEQGGFFAAPQQIGVVAGAMIGVHDDVKDPQIRVQSSHPPDVFCGLQCFHEISVLSITNVKIHRLPKQYTISCQIFKGFLTDFT